MFSVFSCPVGVGGVLGAVSWCGAPWCGAGCDVLGLCGMSSFSLRSRGHGWGGVGMLFPFRALGVCVCEWFLPLIRCGLGPPRACGLLWGVFVGWFGGGPHNSLLGVLGWCRCLCGSESRVRCCVFLLVGRVCLALLGRGFGGLVFYQGSFVFRVFVGVCRCYLFVLVWVFF